MGVDEQLLDCTMATRSLVRLLQQGCRPSLPLESRSQSTAAAALNTRLEEDMEAIRQAGTWKTERVLSTAQSVTVGIAGGSDAVLNFCSNNYLGLSNHPEVVEAGIVAASVVVFLTVIVIVVVFAIAVVVVFGIFEVVLFVIYLLLLLL